MPSLDERHKMTRNGFTLFSSGRRILVVRHIEVEPAKDTRARK